METENKKALKEWLNKNPVINDYISEDDFAGLWDYLFSLNKGSENFFVYLLLETFRELHINPELYEIPDKAFSDLGIPILPNNLNNVIINIDEFIVPETVTKIGMLSFYDSNIKKIILPENLKSLGDSCFAFSRIKEINIPSNSSLDTIPKNCFYECGLNSISIPGTVKKIMGYAFTGCFKLADIVLEEGIEEIKSYAFSSCNCFTSVTIPKSVKKIGNNAFYNNHTLTSIVLPEKFRKKVESGTLILDKLNEKILDIIQWY